jgi:hypothetical protein
MRYETEGEIFRRYLELTGPTVINQTQLINNCGDGNKSSSSYLSDYFSITNGCFNWCKGPSVLPEEKC